MYLEGETCILNKLAIKGLPNRIGERCVIVENNYKSLNYDYLIQFDDMEIAPVKELELNKLTDTDKKHMEYIFTGNTVIHKSSEVKVKILKVDYLLGQAEVEFSDDHSTNVVRFNNLIEAELESDSVEKFKFSIDDTVQAKTKDGFNGIIGRVVSMGITDDGYSDYKVMVGKSEYHFDEEELELVKLANEQQTYEKNGRFTDIALEIGKFTDKKDKQYGSSVDATYEMIKVLMERYKNNDNTYTIPESLLQHILLQVRIMDKQNRIFNNPSGAGDSESPYKDLCGYSLIGIDMVQN